MKALDKNHGTQTNSPDGTSAYEWFPGLSPMHKEDLSQIVEEGFGRRAKERQLATIWPQQVAQSLPALPSAVLDNADYWPDILRVTRQLSSLPAQAIQTIALEWYHHISRNIPGRGTEEEYQPSGENIMPLIDWRAFHQKVGNLGSIGGVLFTGPQMATLIVANQRYGEQEEFVHAHLAAHYLLAHTERNRFGFWLEYLPGCTPKQILHNPEHWYIEEQADESAVCLLEPGARNYSLTPMSRRLIAAFLEIGLPKGLIRLGLSLREFRGNSIITMLHPPQFGPGELCSGSDRQAYIIGEDGKRYWVCSKVLLDAIAGDKRIQHVKDKLLQTIEEGPPIYNLRGVRSWVPVKFQNTSPAARVAPPVQIQSQSPVKP